MPTIPHPSHGELPGELPEPYELLLILMSPAGSGEQELVLARFWGREQAERAFSQTANALTSEMAARSA